MAFPWANTLLLVFIGAEMVSGVFGLLTGSHDRAIYMQAHRVAGFGILVILLWKARNVRGSLRWRRSLTPRAASIVLAVTLIATLGLGLTWSFAGRFSFLWFSGVSWHIYAGVVLAPILLWHSRHHTRGFPVSFWAERRSFLRLAGAVVLGFAAWRVGETAASLGRLAGADRRFTGSYEADSMSGNAFPVVSWLNDRPPRLDATDVRLTVTGAVERDVGLGYDDLVADAELTATIDCTGGWYSTQEWRGVSVARLLEQAKPTDGAASVTFVSATGYYRRFSMDEASAYLLATHVGGHALSHGHGFPLRLVAPGKRGFEWVKWVEAIEVNESSKWWQPPLPLR